MRSSRPGADNLVLRFRGQHLDDEALMRFSAHFGELDLAPVIAAARAKTADGGEVETLKEGPRYVSVISNIIENGKTIGALGAYESIWHTDMSCLTQVCTAKQPAAADCAGTTTGAQPWWPKGPLMPPSRQTSRRAAQAYFLSAGDQLEPMHRMEGSSR
jgi:hypothetical protein